MHRTSKIEFALAERIVVGQRALDQLCGETHVVWSSKESLSGVLGSAYVVVVYGDV